LPISGNRGGLQHPGRAHRPHQGHPLRPADPGPDRRRCGRRPGASAGRRRACGGSALMDAFFINIDWYEIWLATLDTLLMLGGSLLFTVVFGLPLGVLLFLTGPRQLFDHKPLYALLSFVVNVLRSLPFIILLIEIGRASCRERMNVQVDAGSISCNTTIRASYRR